MKSDAENMGLLKAIIKAELNTRQLSILYTLLKENTKTISLTSEEIAKKVKVKSKADIDGEERTGKMSQGNASRDLNAMVLKNVLGRNDKGFYVRTTKMWGTVNKAEIEKINERKLKKEQKKTEK
jgi:hypothetical protein